MKYPSIKENLARLGRFVSPKWIHLGSGVLNYLNVGRWFHDRGLEVPVRCANRQALADALAPLVKEPATYLEFGVFQGATLRHWTNLLRHPESLLHGFDSFEGLPEHWGPVEKNYFKLKEPPRFDDPRVRLIKGWFSDTLPGYLREFKAPDSLVVHLDADLYSSTIFVLRELRPFFRPGTILIFDEFFDRNHELKAFTEFLEEAPFGIECVAATNSLCQAAFRITSMPGSSHPKPSGQKVSNAI